jgi:hypothetical protein
MSDMSGDYFRIEGEKDGIIPTQRGYKMGIIPTYDRR